MTIAALVGGVIGVAIALDAARRPGYVAAYSAVSALALAVVVGVLGFGMLFFTKSRALGPALLIGAGAEYLLFGVSMTVLERRGTWKETMVPLAAARPDLVVLFKEGVGSRATSDFVENVISEPDPRGGHAHRPGVGGILLVRVGRYEGYSITFAQKATAHQRADLRARIANSPVVCEVFENTPAESLRPDQVACP